MNRDQARAMLRRIANGGRLPDQFDVRLADVCADYINDSDAIATFLYIKQRHQILTANKPTEKVGGE